MESVLTGMFVAFVAVMIVVGQAYGVFLTCLWIRHKRSFEGSPGWWGRSSMLGLACSGATWAYVALWAITESDILIPLAWLLIVPGSLFWIRGWVDYRDRVDGLPPPTVEEGCERLAAGAAAAGTVTMGFMPPDPRRVPVRKQARHP